MLKLRCDNQISKYHYLVHFFFNDLPIKYVTIIKKRSRFRLR